jgi:hypothetical protein
MFRGDMRVFREEKLLFENQFDGFFFIWSKLTKPLVPILVFKVPNLVSIVTILVRGPVPEGK